MHEDTLFHIFVIFTGSAALATVALYARQALLVSYIILGVIVGPDALGFVSDTDIIEGIASVGIIFLLFLLGLNLEPQDLVKMFSKTTFLTVYHSVVF